jgi:predicted transcriptional regulator
MANQPESPESTGIAAEEKRRVRHFVAHFNSIQAFLKKQVPDSDKKERWDEFVRLIEWYRKNHKGWGRDYEVLKAFAALRNVIAHEEREPDKHLFIPSAEALNRIEQIRERLEHPLKVIPMFKRPVVTVQLSDTVEKPLTITYAESFSQLPVYDGKLFRGLLTENGITRWLSHIVAKGKPEVDLRCILVSEMLNEEETRPNHEFISREMYVSDLIQRFAENPGLEATLITSTGSKDEKLLGIVTQWDILEAMQA